jgi:hypothetical protein
MSILLPALGDVMDELMPAMRELLLLADTDLAQVRLVAMSIAMYSTSMALLVARRPWH